MWRKTQNSDHTDHADDYEAHPDSYRDGTHREPRNDQKRDDYIRFYRSQAQNFNNRITDAGGVGLNTGSRYWSSSEATNNSAWGYSARDANALNYMKYSTYRIRAVFAF